MGLKCLKSLRDLRGEPLKPVKLPVLHRILENGD
jgi:hypothetical protein